MTLADLLERDDVETIRGLVRQRKVGEITRRLLCDRDEARRLGAELLAHFGETALKSRTRQRAKAKTGPPPIQMQGRTPRSNDEGLAKKLDSDGGMSVSWTGAVKTLDELLDAAGVDREEWLVKEWTANAWTAQRKDDRGVIQMTQVKARLEPRPMWARIQIRPVIHVEAPPAGPLGRPIEKVLIIPDSQNGYRWDLARRHLEPMHDRVAWDLAVQIAEAEQPDVIMLLGDMLDLAPWSLKYPRTADLTKTTQPALSELHWWIGQLRLKCQDARIVYEEGNHEERLRKAVAERLSEADGLRAVGSGYDALSVPGLLNLDALGVEYAGPYGVGVWFWDRVFVHHGVKVKKGGGATAAAVVRESDYSEVFGHVHRVELGYRTIHGPHGVRSVFALSPGTICRVDPVVPGASPRYDWQQGLAMLGLVNGEPDVTHLARIRDGVMCWGGEIYRGRDRVADIIDATGIDAFAGTP